MSINDKKIILLFVSLFLFGSSCLADTEKKDSANDKYKEEYNSIVRRLEYNPDNLVAGNRLREICRQQKIVTNCIDTFNMLSEKHPKNKTIRYHAALAYVDEVPGHTLFKQGWYSTRSMNHMSDVLDDYPTDWSALYIRGLNGIFWPLSFRRIGGAIRDLNKCIEISEKLPMGLKKPYHVLAYVALGDALVKNRDVDEAIKVYTRGVKMESSPKLKQRLSLSKEELKDYVKKIRDRDRPVDTDITFLIDGGYDKI